MITREERLDNLDAAIADDRVIRNKWLGGTRNGKAIACLYVQLVPEFKNSTDACPVDLMQPWLAHLTPWIDDAGTDEHWPVVVRRYAELLRRAHVLDYAGWRRADYRARRAALVVALEYAGEFTSVVRGVMALVDRVLAGDEPTVEEWDAAARAAKEAKEAAEAKAWAAMAVEARATWAAARAATARETSASEAATCAKDAASEAEAAAAAKEADRIIDGILDGLELEVEAKEKR